MKSSWSEFYSLMLATIACVLVRFASAESGKGESATVFDDPATLSPSTASSPDDNTARKYLQPADLAIIVVYLVLLLAFGLYVLCKTDRSSVKAFFLAGRQVTWFPIGASLFSSNITSTSFIGLAGAGAASGIAVGAYEWNAILALIFLGWLFAPAYFSTGVVTLPQYMKKRFGGKRIQIYLSVLSLLIYIFVKISTDLFSGALFFKQALGWNMYIAISFLLLITALYTVTGGLTAVIYTDTVQTVFMFIGTTAMMIVAFIQFGSYDNLATEYMQAVPSARLNDSSCGFPRADSLHMFRAPSSDDMPWPGMILGLTIIDIWYWCTDQVIAQRTLAARSLNHAKGGCIAAGLMKILPMYMMVMVGMASRVLYPDEIACTIPEKCEMICGTRAGCSNIAYPKLVMEILPTGLKGLLLASMLAALMSSLSSVFNSASTLFTCDLWLKMRKDASELELMIIGRIFTLLMVVVAFIWVPIVQSYGSGQLFDYSQSVTSYLAPPIAVVFLLAVLWRRFNEQGAFWGLMVGCATGVIRMILDFSYGAPLCGEPEYRPAILYKVHYLHFAILLAGLTAIVAICVALITPERHAPMETSNKESLIVSSPGGGKCCEDDVGETKVMISNEKCEVGDEPPKPSFKISTEKTSRGPVMTCATRLCELFCGFDAAKKDVKATTVSVMVVDKSEKKWHSYIVNVFAGVNILIMVILFIIYR